MNAPIFKTYGEAAAYAKRRAQELGTTVKFGRSNDEWAVFIEPEQAVAITARPDNPTKPPSATKYLSWSERQRENEREAEEIARRSEDRRREAEKESCEAEKKEWQEQQERRSYIEERKRYYRSLSEEQLDKLWNSRESHDLGLDEIALLREIVRGAKGIAPAYGNSVRVCRQCGMVEDSCTCGRSWF